MGGAAHCDVIDVAADVALRTQKCLGSSARESGVLLRVREELEKFCLHVGAMERDVELAECVSKVSDCPVRDVCGRGAVGELTG